MGTPFAPEMEMNSLEDTKSQHRNISTFTSDDFSTNNGELEIKLESSEASRFEPDFRLKNVETNTSDPEFGMKSLESPDVEHGLNFNNNHIEVYKFKSSNSTEPEFKLNSLDTESIGPKLESNDREYNKFKPEFKPITLKTNNREPEIKTNYLQTSYVNNVEPVIKQPTSSVNRAMTGNIFVVDSGLRTDCHNSHHCDDFLCYSCFEAIARVILFPCRCSCDSMGSGGGCGACDCGGCEGCDCNDCGNCDCNACGDCDCGGCDCGSCDGGGCDCGGCDCGGCDCSGVVFAC